MNFSFLSQGCINDVLNRNNTCFIILRYFLIRRSEFVLFFLSFFSALVSRLVVVALKTLIEGTVELL